MKNNLWFVGLMFVLCLAMVPGLSQAGIIESQNIKTSLINQEPDPVQPGRYVELRFRVENIGLVKADDLSFELVLGYPFSLEPGDTTTRYVGTMYGRATGNDSVTLYYKLRVDPNAIEGDNKVQLKYTTDKGKIWTLIDPIVIRVQTTDTLIGISEVKTEPKRLEPGKEARVTFVVNNIGDSYIQDVTVKINLDSTTLPFAPLNSATEKKIRTMKAGEKAEFAFDIITMGNAESNIYKVPVTLKYTDQTGTVNEKDDIISLVVGTAPDIQVMLDKQSVYTSGAVGDISIKFVNKGVTNAKFMNVQLDANNGLEIISPNTVYIGKLDSDDFETADFNVYVRPTKEKIVSVPLTIDYTDANNQAYHKEINLELRLYTAEDMKKLGMVKGNSLVGILIVVLIVGVGYFIYRRRKSKAKAR